MADFNSLRVFFSAEDEGAQDLTELEFLKLNREDAENLIKHVKNAKNRSHLQEIYDTAHPLLLQGKFYIDFMMLSNTFLDLLNISCCIIIIIIIIIIIFAIIPIPITNTKYSIIY